MPTSKTFTVDPTVGFIEKYIKLKYQGELNISNFFFTLCPLLLLQNPGAMCSLLTFKLSKI